MNKPLLVLIIPILLVFAIACQPLQPTVEEAQQQAGEAESDLCASIDAYAASLEALNGVSADTTVEELEQLNQAADDAYEAMLQAAGELTEAELQVVSSAVTEYQQSIGNIAPESTLGDAAAQVQQAAATVHESVAQLRSATACGEGTE